MKVIVAGSRTATWAHVIEAMRTAEFVKEITCVISGGARGADSHGEEVARRKGWEILRFPAQWDKFGKSAGYRRNEEMAEHADALIATWDGLSPGTRHMIETARKKGLRLHVHIFQK